MANCKREIHIQIARNDNQRKAFYRDAGVRQGIGHETLVIFVLDRDLSVVFVTKHPGRKQFVDIQRFGLQIYIPRESVFADQRAFESAQPAAHLNIRSAAGKGQRIQSHCVSREIGVEGRQARAQRQTG